MSVFVTTSPANAGGSHSIFGRLQYQKYDSPTDYDGLLYHLGAPRAFLDAGRIVADGSPRDLLERLSLGGDPGHGAEQSVGCASSRRTAATS